MPRLPTWSASLTEPLHYAERPAAGEPVGLLVLCHGRGSDEHDLLPLADVIDPEARLHAVAPRGPLRLPGSPGYHWYVVPRVGHPDPPTFAASRAALAALHDELWARTGLSPGQTVLGGFSQGTVMSYAMGFDPGRPAVAGILAFSGFIPTVPGWEPDLAGRPGTLVFISHGQGDPVISVEFARNARRRLTAAGLAVDYGESGAPHMILPGDLRRARAWLADVLPAGAAR